MEEAAAKRRRHRKNARVQAEQVPCACHSPGIACPGKTFGPGKNLANCDFQDSAFFSVDLRGSNISGAIFVGSDFFNHPTFRGANASNACFFNADLSFSDFRGTNVHGAIFCEALLFGVDFRGSNVTAAQIASAQVGCDTILPNGKPAVQCAAGQICCTGDCCAPENCQQGTCLQPGS